MFNLLSKIFAYLTKSFTDDDYVTKLSQPTENMKRRSHKFSA